ncbi:hypothetical protein B7755_002775 [Streptomyces sp. NBS 14/10]|uniref:hypothetical protein n=1 Tax=Streptomyces sp. NBS 14/10 TaxID=1945643 RepID=UPI000B7C6828|nr:hypothetical protein [Streptomyces sp. NBS 14/10]KAK1177176.1 hypothetical protein B7755_002775 [Streptomyces sp. NBS 14/10]
MLLRLAYLGVSNAFAMLHLLPMTDQDKDAETLALRHQITVLERPDTVLRWHRSLVARRHAASCRRKHPGRPRM